ncbi:MAG TPA: IS110 family transposase [Gemmatimonadales bacterium]|nr:IS110 family transposase [Gemmatimonadales bacterium]
MRYYIGVDWADAEHAVWVEDETGTKVRSHRVAQTVEGLQEWGRWLDEQRAAGVELWAAIERPEGRIVDFLLDHGVVVFPINPKALDRARDRFRVSGAKSDPFDARVLATFLRTDHGHLAPLQPSSEAAQELKGLTRDHARQVRQQTRLLNQVTATLKAYYPRALEIVADLTTQWGRAFLRDYPMPAALASLTERQWQRWARQARLSGERTAELWAVLRPPQLAVPPHVVRVHQRRLAALLAQLEVTGRAVDAYREAIADFFASMPAANWATSLPGGRSGTTVATLYAELGDAPGRWQTFRHLQGHAGTVPVTDRSGKQLLVKFRFACNTHLRQAAHQFAFQSLGKSEWARAYYDRCRARGQKHHHALRALAAKWLKIIFVLWTRQVAYDETYHLAMMTRQHLRQTA